MSQAEFDKNLEETNGYCTECESITCEDVEPDEYNASCPECSYDAVVGMQRALNYGEIDITEENDEEDMDVGIVYFGSEDDT